MSAGSPQPRVQVSASYRSVSASVRRTNLVRHIDSGQEAQEPATIPSRIGRRHVRIIVVELLWTAEHSFNYAEQLAGKAPVDNSRRFREAYTRATGRRNGNSISGN